jgi:hypothetical protein
MLKVQYSVLCHYPSIVSKDCLTLGILFHNVTENICEFKSIRRWDRAKAFNDELDIEVIKLQLEGIKEEVSEFISEGNFVMKKYTKFYVNELKFTEIVTVNIKDSFQDFVEQCVRQYMPLDLDRSSRPNNIEKLQFIKSILKDSEIEYQKGQISGFFNENVKFDFIIGNYAFKIFKFQNKQENRLIQSVKDWAYDAYKLKNRYKVIFVVDVDFSEEKYNTLYNILEEESERVLTFNDLLSFIQQVA